MSEFRETREQEAARKRVLKWWKRDCGWGRKESRQPSTPAERYTPPVKREGPGPMDPGEAHEYGVTPSPSSKQPRYNRPGRPATDGPILSRYEVNRRYRERQKEIPCRVCGAPSWGGGLCQADYKRKQRGVIPRLIEAQMAQQQEAQPCQPA